MADNYDIVSDLTDGTEDTSVSVNESNVPSHGADALDINNQNPARAATVVDKPKAAVEGEKPLSLRDQISSSLKAEPETPPAATQDGKVRDPVTGQFVPKPADPVIDPAAAPASAVVAPQGIDPQVFQSLPAETQAHLARTMDDLNTRQQQVASLEQVSQVIGAERRQAWALNGMNEAQAINQLLALSDYATRDPAGFIQYFSQQQNVDLEALVLDQEPVDPQYDALTREVQALRNEREQDRQQQAQTAHQQTVQSVEAFAMEKGQDGNILRPYFNELGAEVLPFITAVKNANPNMPQNQVLQEAYDRACWGSPTVRAKMQAATNAASDAERLRADADRTARARQASTSIPSGTPAAAPAAPNSPSRSLRDTISAAIAATN